MKILILGSSGMLGYSLFKNLTAKRDLEVFGLLRDKQKFQEYFSKEELKNIYEVDLAENVDEIEKVFQIVRADYLINCAGSIPQKEYKINNLIYLNSLLPHILRDYCDKYSAKLIQFSTDCVFSGKKGNYSETDPTDATDLYGRTKILGEVNSKNHLTIRTSIIGHELFSKVSLVEWFLDEKQKVKGFKNAIFSGFPCAYWSEILNEYVFTNQTLGGVIHIASEPIDKFELLSKIAKVYRKEIQIEEYENYFSNKSLNSDLFNKLVGFKPPKWDELIIKMNKDYRKNFS